MRSAAGICLAIILLLLILPGAAVDADMYEPLHEVENPGVPVITPEEVIDLEVHGEAGDIALSTDGERLIFNQHAQVLDVGAALIWYWPEFAFGVVGLLLLWRLLAALRRRRRFPIEQGPFCRKCAYPTKGHASDQCPECGKALSPKGITPGVTVFRTIVTTLITVGPGLILSMIYLSDTLPRSGSINNMINWHSEQLGSWAMNENRESLMPHMRGTTAIRSLAIGRSGTPETIGHVPWEEDHYLYGMLHMPGTSRRHESEVILSNEASSHAWVSTRERYALVNLDSMSIQASGRRNDEIFRFNHLSRGGQRLYDAKYYGDSRAWYRQALDGSDRAEIPQEIRSTVRVPISVRPDGFLTGNPVRDAEILAQPFMPAQLRIDSFQVGTDTFQSLHDSRSSHLVGRFHAGYLVVIADNTVLIYDMIQGQWIAELDIRAFADWHVTPIGTPIAISADRRTVAVLNPDGKEAAVYRLPDPAIP